MDTVDTLHRRGLNWNSAGIGTIAGIGALRIERFGRGGTF